MMEKVVVYLADECTYAEMSQVIAKAENMASEKTGGLLAAWYCAPDMQPHNGVPA
ncbi:MAG: hypothetical protein ABFD81_12320 [Syntrophaceae bacterium]